jgi:hypothetical protein
MNSLDHRICRIICNVIGELKDLSSLRLIRLEIYIAISRGEGLTHAQKTWYVEKAISYFIIEKGREQLEQMSKEEPVREDAALQTRGATNSSDRNFSAPGSTANAVEAEEKKLGDQAFKASVATEISRGVESTAREDSEYLTEDNTTEQAAEMREEESAREDASLQKTTTTIDLHECEVIGSGVDQAPKVQVAAALSGGVETPALDDSEYLSDDYTPAKATQTKICKKESAGVDAVLRIHEAIDLHDRVVIDGGILAQANMAALEDKMRTEESAKLDSASLRPDTLMLKLTSSASRNKRAPTKYPPLAEPYRRAIFTCRQCFQVMCRRHRPGVILRVLIPYHGCRPPPAPNLKVTESIFKRTRDGSNFGG